MEKRPAKGIWAGLYCLPVYESEAALEQAAAGLGSMAEQQPGPFLHVLTHKDLHLHPVRLDGMPVAGMALAEGAAGGWYAADQWQGLGLPAPVRKLLETQLPVPLPV